ncbi:MAG: trypsin-like peptidase domain-containing protein [Anaerolineae bacterium]|nr:trypsin-like peptidase domain-containing protein [Anaerolineae bacterium]
MSTTKARLLFGLALLWACLAAVPFSQALDRPTAQRVMRSVVQLVAVDEKPSGLVVPLWGGSGTILTADGLILTNCHVALPRAMWDDPQFDYDLMVVALTVRADEPPRPTYLAEVVQYDPDLDLAVIQVAQMLDGSPVDREQLDLPALPQGNSDDLDLGDRLYIFGYPGIGGETITFTSGNVSGFTREQGVEGRAWIKTDATVAGGNSGGTAVNEQGELVGIPTQSGAGGDGQYVDCRRLADTNDDGRIDENDSCIPVGGFINALRPVNLAKPLVEAARQGLVRLPAPSPVPPDRQPQPSSASFGPITFAEGVDRKGEPVRPGTAFRSGLDELYAVFAYEGMANGLEWGWQWTVNGRSLPLQRQRWDAGAQGRSWIQLYSNRGALPDGDYRLDLLLAGETVRSGACTIGPAPAEPATPPAPAAEGVEVYGRITDAETNKGIAGAVFIVLQPGITVDAFRWTQEEVYARAESDRRGYFELPAPLRRGETYSWIVAARGYKPILEDGIAIGAEVESPYELNMALPRSR